MHWIGLGVLGLAIGAIGTLIGAGGGFLLMPILALMYPDARPETLASISLGVVFLNALSGSYGYARQKLIDFRAGWLFMAVGIPGAICGSFVTALIPRRAFDITLGAVLAAMGLFIIISGALRPRSAERAVSHARRWGRAFILKGAAISLVVGFVSSLLGIGGGIIHVPAMVYALGFPVHTAAATSHFVLAGTSFFGTATHAATGGFAQGLGRTAAIGGGAMIGAQIGARFAKRTPPGWIMRGLGVALVLAGARVAWVAIG